jgi:hypothetical protein
LGFVAEGHARNPGRSSAASSVARRLKASV